MPRHNGRQTDDQRLESRKRTNAKYYKRTRGANTKAARRDRQQRLDNSRTELAKRQAEEIESNIQRGIPVCQWCKRKLEEIEDIEILECLACTRDRKIYKK